MQSTHLKETLVKLLSESIDSVKQRESETLDVKMGGIDGDFLLFGAGNLGRKTLKLLSKLGKRPLAFIDNNPELRGKEIDSVKIMSPLEAAKLFDVNSVGIITTIWCGEATDKMSDRLQPVKDLGFKKIALFGHLAWKFSDNFLPHYSLDLPSKVILAKASILKAYDLLSDDESRLLFIHHISWRLFLDYDELPPPSKYEIYFNEKFVTNDSKEVLYDIGAFTGDSVEAFLKTPRAQAFKEIHSFEPSPKNYIELNNYINSLNGSSGKFYAHQLALGDSVGVIQVESDHGPASRVGLGNITVDVSTIDEFSESHSAPTFIKIDIEGFEPNCLAGAKNVIIKDSPVVAVCVYHLQAHIWEILLQLDSYTNSYSYYLCPHLADGWDLVAYAVPKERSPLNASLEVACA